MRVLSLLSATAALVLTACAVVVPPAQTQGDILVGGNGHSLYTFDKDPADASKSVCNGPCAVNWPPLLAQDGVEAPNGWTRITRDDGRQQWAFKGKPLYFWIKDQKPGDRSGDGVNQVWRLARP